MKLLVIIVVIVCVIAIAQLMRVYELASRLRGNKEEEISYRDNRINAYLFPVFLLALYVSFFWLVSSSYGGAILLHPSSSAHGEGIDGLLNFNWIIVVTVFFICNTLLFWFAARYYDKPGAKAYYYPHNNKLELIWTVLPAVVMAVIIIYGLRIWNEVTDEASEEAINIELYAEQFKWTARYDGANDGLGEANYTLINMSNPLGLITESGVANRIDELDSIILRQWAILGMDSNYVQPNMLERWSDMGGRYSELTTAAHDSTMPDADRKDLIFKFERNQRHLARVIDFQNKIESDTLNRYAAGENDFLVQEIHIPVGQEINLQMRSKDVIHSAYLPYFRVQMNCVPGMNTYFKFTPTRTTAEMRDDPLVIDNMKEINESRAAKGLEEVEFDYYLLCNKICGVSHYNMKLKVIVESECDYKKWFEFTNFETRERRLDSNGQPVTYDCECDWENEDATVEVEGETSEMTDELPEDTLSIEAAEPIDTTATE